MIDSDFEEMAKAIQERIKVARERQANPGLYALLHANGMPFLDLVGLITEDAMMMWGEDEL